MLSPPARENNTSLNANACYHSDYRCQRNGGSQVAMVSFYLSENNLILQFVMLKSIKGKKKKKIPPITTNTASHAGIRIWKWKASIEVREPEARNLQCLLRVRKAHTTFWVITPIQNVNSSKKEGWKTEARENEICNTPPHHCQDVSINLQLDKRKIEVQGQNYFFIKIILTTF